MKKKIVLCFLTAILLCGTFGSCAENQVPSIRDMVMTEQQKSFLFRNGVTWGMNPQQVSIVENIPMKQFNPSEWSVLLSDSPVQVSRFYADLVYIFYQNALRMISYEFQNDCTVLNYQYLTGALCSLYGESRESNPSVIKGWMDRVYPNHYQLELIQRAAEWTTEDGTSIYLYYFTDKNYAILYVCPTSGGNNSGYDTNGL